ncbi:MAG: hypothetical protein ACLSE8_04915 [Parasutterella sp.]
MIQVPKIDGTKSKSQRQIPLQLRSRRYECEDGTCIGRSYSVRISEQYLAIGATAAAV